MNGELFKEWFHEQFVPAVKTFCLQNNLPVKAILFLDNAPSHPEESQLISGDIKTKFFPPNVTSILQPMDQEVLQNIKRSYRKQLIKKLLEEDKDNPTIPQRLKKVNIKDAIYWVSDAWTGVSDKVLQRSWKKVWPDLSFRNKDLEKDHTSNQSNENQMLQLLNRIPGCETTTLTEMNEWLTPDNEKDHLYTDVELIDMVSKNSDSVDSDDEVEEGGKENKVSHSDAATAFETALEYISQQQNSTPHDILFIRKWLNSAAAGRAQGKQVKIDSFFAKH